MPRLERRPEPSHAMIYASPAIAVVLTIATSMAMFGLLGKGTLLCGGDVC